MFPEEFVKIKGDNATLKEGHNKYSKHLYELDINHTIRKFNSISMTNILLHLFFFSKKWQMRGQIKYSLTLRC